MKFRQLSFNFFLASRLAEGSVILVGHKVPGSNRVWLLEMEPRWVWLQSLPLPWRVTITVSNWQDEDLPQVAHYGGEVTGVDAKSASLDVQLDDDRRITLHEEPETTDVMWFHWEDVLDQRQDHPSHDGWVFWQPYWSVDLWLEYQAFRVFDALPLFDRALSGVVTTYCDPDESRRR